MTSKEKVLALLENNKGTYISGASLAEQIGVSRNAVWKLINSLKTDGYQITAVTNKGYCLSEKTDIISPQSIKKYLKNYKNIFDIEVFETIDSTNNYVKELALKGEKEGKVVAARMQTGGKGRYGRKFFSPADCGIYMSILLKPNIGAENSLYITTSAAVAVAKAIEKVSNKTAKIKWVNDIFCDDKKVCGILTEASLNIENGGLDFAVLGIGINIKPPKNGFDDQIKNVAGSIFDSEPDLLDARSILIAEILQEFWGYYVNLNEKSFLEEYKNRSNLYGRKITVIKGENKTEATAISIDDDCRLKVRYNDNCEETLFSGEVSIKL